MSLPNPSPVPVSLRDSGPYSARNSSKGVLIAEAGRLVNGLCSGLSVSDLRSQALDGALFTQRARATRRRIWDTLHQRYVSAQPEWVLNDLKAAYCESDDGHDFAALLYIHYAWHDRLMFDFVTKVLWNRWINQQRAVVREDVLFLLDQAAEVQPQIRRWTDSTRIKLAGNVLTALRDFGVLEGKQKKALIKPTMSQNTATHLLRLLLEEGTRGGDILHDTAWQLFMRSESEVVDLVNQIALDRRIRFERVGNIVVLEPPAEWRVVI